MFNTERFIKILALTTSPEDGEALAAIRKANELLKGASLTWATIIAFTPKRDDHSRDAFRYSNPKPNFYTSEPKHGTETEQISKMLKFLKLKDLGLKTNNFVSSLHQHFVFRGALTPKQLAALKKIYTQQGGS